MEEENKSTYQVFACRYDLVTITAEEYRDLIISGESQRLLASERLSEWYKERERANKLAEEVEKLAVEADELRKQVCLLKAKPDSSQTVTAYA